MRAFLYGCKILFRNVLGGPKKACIVYGVTFLSPFTKILTNCITNCKFDMKIIDHAFERFEERVFTPEMAARLVNGKRLLRRSKSNPSRYKAIGKVDGEFWVVVLEKDLYTVVTARRAHKDEEVLWKNLK